eukprot:352099-Chlamydomonas_euryale.AAC.3
MPPRADSSLQPFEYFPPETGCPDPHRWMIPLVWQYSSASTVSAMYCRATSSSNAANLRKRL